MLRIVIITEEDPIYVLRFFETFFDAYPRSEIDVCAITVSSAFAEPLAKTVRRMWSFYGPADFLRLGARYARSRIGGRTISKLARDEGIPELATRSVNDPDYVARLRALKPDVIVSVAAPEIFKAELLGSARLGCVNLHSGMLPRYRGMMPVFWQMQQGERDATVSVHEMVPKLDAGDLLATARFPIRSADRLDRVIVGTKRLAARLLIDVLRDLAAGRAVRQPPPTEGAGYFTFPTRADAGDFRARGHRLL